MIFHWKYTHIQVDAVADLHIREDSLIALDGGLCFLSALLL